MISIEVDGEHIAFDDFYEESDFYPCGALWGMDEKTEATHKIRGYESTNCVWPLAAWRKNKDGSIFGIQGLFARGQWAVGEDGKPLYRVWDRII